MCVGKLCVSELGGGRRRRTERRRTEVHNQKKEPHTMMWGKNKDFLTSLQSIVLFGFNVFFLVLLFFFFCFIVCLLFYCFF